MAKESSKPADKQPDQPTEKTVTSEKPKTGKFAGWWSEKQNRRNALGIGLSILAGIIAFLVIFGVLIYKYKSDSNLVYSVARVVPYPIEQVNGHYITYGQYLFEVRSAKHFYSYPSGPDKKPQIDLNTADGKKKFQEVKKQTLDQMKADAITTQLEKKYKITVTSKELNDYMNQIYKQAGGQDQVKKVIAQYYGWNMNDLRSKVRFQLAKQKLADKISNDESINAQAKSQAQDILNKVKAGGDFGALAKQYSQDPGSAANGGDLGWFGKGVMDPDFEKAAFALPVGAVSDQPVKSQFGYHIIKVLEKKDDGSQVHAAHILIKSIDLDTYLQDQISKAKVHQYFHV